MTDADRVVLPAYTVGPDAFSSFPDIVKPLGERVFLAGGHTALSVGQGLLEVALKGSGVRMAGIAHYSPDCTMQAAGHLAEAARAAGAQVIIGMGGGRALDTAKAAASLLHLSVVTVPTIAATCAAVSALSVMYHEDGSFSHSLRLDMPPRHAFIHTGILAAAPGRYLRAGMGDSTAKHVESTFSARGRSVNHRNALGLACSDSCFTPLMDIGARAFGDNEQHIDSQAFRDAVLCNIVSTGIVSILVDEGYNGALAHCLYYVLEELPQVAAQCLHGEVVAWGVLVLLVMDRQHGRARDYARFLDALRIPRTLKAMGVDPDDPALGLMLHKALGYSDMDIVPYPVSRDMVHDAILAVERMP